MTLPSEELRALKRAHYVLYKLLMMPKKELVAMPIAEFRELINSCLRHWPYDFVVEKLWKDRIDKEMG
jgi:hypothetical protein